MTRTLLLLASLLLLGAAAAQQETTTLDNMTRENTEWLILRWEQAPDTTRPRVLLMGDSIANQYSGEVSSRLRGKANVDLLATSKSICDPALLREVTIMVQDYKYAVIHFNNGLHGFHLDEAAYEAGLRRLIALLRQLQPQAKLVWANSTPIVDAKDVGTLAAGNATVLQRNALAAKVTAELGLPTDDLYSVSVGHPEYRNVGDGYHYNGAGKTAQAEVVTRVIEDALR